jgi:hypothetical protein
VETAAETSGVNEVSDTTGRMMTRTYRKPAFPPSEDEVDARGKNRESIRKDGPAECLKFGRRNGNDVQLDERPGMLRRRSTRDSVLQKI